ncbi:CopG family transcriptional regulator [Paenibacillus alvei]|uniref:CopG family transcriptional regulator n=1 Tax=Paenibacillus alvei TaxID=44250 RepID=UPI00227ED251|nr:CopG family transcriptional regulator [Paenibacillus alvei]MCY9738133.1 CopG family transcriptional regulator [Paenibacillus alvei]
MSDTEKISVNVGAVDLGKIDLLVENSFYKDRTDFVRDAIRSKLDTHDEYVKSKLNDLKEQGGNGFTLQVNFGSSKLTRKELEEVLHGREPKLMIISLGSFTVNDDIDVDLFSKTVRSIKTMGILNASPEIKKHIKKEL